MALQAKVGTISTTTGTANIAETGLGFQPKAVLLWGVGRTADGQEATIQQGIGAFTASTARAANSWMAKDGTTPDQAERAQEFGCYGLMDDDGVGWEGLLDAVSLDADGFTVVPDQAFSADFIVNYLALGGSDLTDALCQEHEMPSATGNFSVTGVGFQPDALILFCGSEDTTGNDQDHPEGGFGLGGFATSSTARYALASQVDGVQNAGVRAANDRCLVTIAGGDQSIQTACDFVNFGADGFTLNKTNGGKATRFGYLALKGGQYAVGDLLSQTATGQFSETGVGFQPSGLLLLHAADLTAFGGGFSLSHSIGAASAATERGVTWVGYKDNSPADNQERQDTTKVFARYNVESPHGVIGEGDFVSFDADGFTLDQTTADNAGHLLFYIAAGSEPAGGGPDDFFLLPRRYFYYR